LEEKEDLSGESANGDVDNPEGEEDKNDISEPGDEERLPDELSSASDRESVLEARNGDRCCGGGATKGAR
jgi:hypothetical protein